MRVWFFLTALLFVARCADQARPYLKIFFGGREPAHGQAAPSSELAVNRLRLASWNLEWLDEPGRGPNARKRRDYQRLAHYAEALNADVIAVQEVASELALALVFPPERYAYHLARTGRSQRSGFVYRRSLNVQEKPDLEGLAVHELRAGADLAVRVGESEIRLLSVHLKAFCATGPLNPKDLDCEKLKEQLPALKAWIDQRMSDQVPFAVVGDFNRALADERDALLQEIEGPDPSAHPLLRASPARLGMCNRSSHLEAVDHVLLGGPAASWLLPQSFRELVYEPVDVSNKVKLSDHCPIALELAPPKNAGMRSTSFE